MGIVEEPIAVVGPQEQMGAITVFGVRTRVFIFYARPSIFAGIGDAGDACSKMSVGDGGAFVGFGNTCGRKQRCADDKIKSLCGFKNIANTLGATANAFAHTGVPVADTVLIGAGLCCLTAMAGYHQG